MFTSLAVGRFVLRREPTDGIPSPPDSNSVDLTLHAQVKCRCRVCRWTAEFEMGTYPVAESGNCLALRDFSSLICYLVLRWLCCDIGYLQFAERDEMLLLPTIYILSFPVFQCFFSDSFYVSQVSILSTLSSTSRKFFPLFRLLLLNPIILHLFSFIHLSVIQIPFTISQIVSPYKI
jgi:hypothetical protein